MDDQRDSGTGSSRSTAPNRAIWTERALLALIVGSLAATVNLLVAIQRQATPPSLLPVAPATISQQSAPPPSLPAAPAISRRPPEPVSVAPPPEDPTKKAVAGLATATALELDAGQQADRRAQALDTAREASAAESHRWKRRELLVRQQIAGLATRADELERTASTLDAERDVLAQERDALKAALFKAGLRSGFAVLPYKGPNGTWRRPIVLECTAGGVKLQPKGSKFTSLELSPLVNPRSSPLVRAVAREMLQIQASDTPDGAAAVPYLVFLVRPNGIRPYYEARTCLEPLGIAFGYELIEQDLQVDIPDFNNVATWDGSVPLDIPVEPAPGPKMSVATNSASDRGVGESGRWPESAGRVGRPAGDKHGESESATPEDFVWPTRGRQNGTGGGGNSAPNDSSRGGVQDDEGGTGLSARGTGAGRSGFPGTGASTGSAGNQPSSGGSLGTGNAFGPSGSDRHSGMGSGSNPTPGDDVGSGSKPGGGLGSGSSAPMAGRGNLPAFGRPPALPGSGSGDTANGGGSPLPELEPASDAGFAQPRQSGAISPAGVPPGSGDEPLPPLPGTGTGTGAGQYSAGPSAAGGSRFTATGPDGAGQSQGSGANLTGQGMMPKVAGTGSSTGDPAADPGASPGLDQGPSLGGPSGNNPGSLSGASNNPSGNPTGLPGSGQPQRDRDGSQGASGSSGSLDVVSSASAAGQPSQSMSLPGGLTTSSSASSSGSGVPSSSPPASSSSMGGGMPLDALSASSSSSSSSSSAFGQNASAAAKSTSSDDLIFSPPPRHAPPPGSIEVPFEIVVVCRQNDILLHPGGYRLTAQAIRQQAANKDSLLAREIGAVVRKRAIVDPMIRPKPKIKFLVETNGSETFWEARRQLLFSLPDWPMSLQVAGTQGSHVFTKETW